MAGFQKTWKGSERGVWRLLTSVTPVIMFWMREKRVLTEQDWVFAPNQMRILMYVPYLLVVFCLTFLISQAICPKSLTSLPLGPAMETFLALTVAVTKQTRRSRLEISYMGWSDLSRLLKLTIVRNLHKGFSQQSSHFAYIFFIK